MGALKLRKLASHASTRMHAHTCQHIEAFSYNPPPHQVWRRAPCMSYGCKWRGWFRVRSDLTSPGELFLYKCERVPACCAFWGNDFLAVFTNAVYGLVRSQTPLWTVSVLFKNQTSSQTDTFSVLGHVPWFSEVNHSDRKRKWWCVQWKEVTLAPFALFLSTLWPFSTSKRVSLCFSTPKSLKSEHLTQTLKSVPPERIFNTY